jgi:transcriptional regulator with XRE-family HTH domain
MPRRRVRVNERGYFATWIRGKMTERELTQERLAAALGVTERCVQNWRDGDRVPGRAWEVIGLAHVLGIAELRVLEAIVGGPAMVEHLARGIREREREYEKEGRCRPRQPQSVRGPRGEDGH